MKKQKTTVLIRTGQAPRLKTLFLWQGFQLAHREKRPVLYRWVLKKNQPGFDKTSNPGWLSAGKGTVRRKGGQPMCVHRNGRNKSKVF